jgi:hypothetical protein
MKMLFNALIPTTCLLCFLNFTADAQLIKSGKNNGGSNKACISMQSVLQKQYICRLEKYNRAAAKTTSAVGERLKAFCGYNLQDTSYYPYGRSDSGYYFYSGSRSSVFNYQMMDYESPSFGTYTSPVDLDYPLSLTWDPTKSGILRKQLFPDSVYSWNSFYPSGGSALYGFADNTGYVYTGSDLTRSTDSYYPNIAGERTRSDYYYDTLGNLSLELDFSYDTVLHAWDTTSSLKWYYNSNNQMILDSASVKSNAGAWTENGKTILTYDGSGNLKFTEDFTDSSGHWQPVTMRFLNYNSDSSLHTDSVSQYNAGFWSPYTRDSFGYTSGISYFTFDQTDLFISNEVWASCSYTKHVSLSGLPDTLYYCYFGGNFGPLSTQMAGKKTIFEYDSANNPVLSQSLNYILTDTLAGIGSYGTSPERIFHYYYESYNATEVQHIISNEEPILFYPNPTINELTISRPESITGAATVIRITSQMGQTISEIRMLWTSKTETISLSGLAPGMYIVSVLENTGKPLATQKLLKL